MAAPHDLYIRFLITKGADTPEKAEEELNEMFFPVLQKADYFKQYDNVCAALPQHVMAMVGSGSLSDEFLRWMDILEIGDLWKGERRFADENTRRALALIRGIRSDPHLTLSLNALLIKAVPYRELAEALNMRFSAMLTEMHVEMYHRLFFDPRRMTRRDWRGFLRSCSPQDRHIYFTALSEPLEVLKNELEMPTRAESGEILQHLLLKAYGKAKQYLQVSTKEANSEARAWISQVVGLVDKVEKYKTSDKADFAKVLTMEFDFIENTFPTPDDTMLAEIMEKQKAGTKDKKK